MLETIYKTDIATEEDYSLQTKTMLKIMIIDDSPESLDGMGEALALNEYPNKTFVSAKKAIETYSLEKFDVVITDYKMPEMNGLDVCKAIKAKNPDACVILISGYMDFATLNTQDIHACLRKPLDLGKLMDLLDKIAEKIL